MADISNKTLTIVIGIALVVSLVGFFSLPNSPLYLAGLVTSQGQARLNITETASLNVTESMIDFGNGTIEQDDLNCTLTSETPSDPDPIDCWTGSGAISGGFNAVNIGNVNLNVTLQAVVNGTNTTEFWGDSTATGGKYLWKCVGNNTIRLSTYSEVQNVTTDCITNLSSIVGSDGFTVHINITIAPTAVGLRNDTITFAATKTYS